jgi:hypothetical protein
MATEALNWPGSGRPAPSPDAFVSAWRPAQAGGHLVFAEIGIVVVRRIVSLDVIRVGACRRASAGSVVLLHDLLGVQIWRISAWRSLVLRRIGFAI